MTTIEDNIKEALARYLNRQGVMCTRVIDWWADAIVMNDFNGCLTCGYDTTIDYTVYIEYKTSGSHDTLNYEYSGSFTDLIKELTD